VRNRGLEDTIYEAFGLYMQMILHTTRSRFQVKPATLLIPIHLFFSSGGSFGGRILRYPVPKWLLFLNECGEGRYTACIVFSLPGILVSLSPGRVPGTLPGGVSAGAGKSGTSGLGGT
jgi:hypothetical protein